MATSTHGRLKRQLASLQSPPFLEHEKPWRCIWQARAHCATVRLHSRLPLSSSAASSADSCGPRPRWAATAFSTSSRRGSGGRHVNGEAPPASRVCACRRSSGESCTPAGHTSLLWNGEGRNADATCSTRAHRRAAVPGLARSMSNSSGCRCCRDATPWPWMLRLSADSYLKNHASTTPNRQGTSRCCCCAAPTGKCRMWSAKARTIRAIICASATLSSDRMRHRSRLPGRPCGTPSESKL